MNPLKTRESLDKLKILCDPLTKWLNTNRNPYTAIMITSSGMHVVEDVGGVQMRSDNHLLERDILILEALDDASNTPDNYAAEPHRFEMRRFEVVEQNSDLEDAFHTLVAEKQLTRRELALILLYLRVRSGFSRQDFDI